jgi:hypothetical protein
MRGTALFAALRGMTARRLAGAIGACGLRARDRAGGKLGTAVDRAPERRLAVHRRAR